MTAQDEWDHVSDEEIKFTCYFLRGNSTVFDFLIQSEIRARDRESQYVIFIISKILLQHNLRVLWPLENAEATAA